LSSSVGLASSFRSVPDLWHHRIGSTPDAEAMRYRDHGRWRSMSWGEAGSRVRAIANGLLSLGTPAEARCILLSETCVEWILTDFAILCAGAATTTIYPMASDSEVQHITQDSGAMVAFVDTPEQADRLLRLRDRTPALRHIVVFSGGPVSERDGVMSLAELERRGQAFGGDHPEAYTEAHRAVQPHHLATLMYTSGTTGLPKGVMLTHDAWVYEAEAIDALGFMNPADVHLLWLPLAHVFAKVLELCFVRLGIPTVVDGSSEDLVENLLHTRPTWFAGVPRTFEKARDAILAGGKDGSRLQRKVFRWAMDVGIRRSRAQREGRSLSPRLRLESELAERLVFREIRARFGGRLRFMISGGAALPVEVAEFFHAIGMLLLEGYGLTESSAASCVNRLDDWKFGTVGLPLPGCRVKVADDGEILVHSRGVMRGYWNLPGETALALTDDGWLRTGDLGKVLPSGHVQITGRKKELIVTSGGKNIAPVLFEGKLSSRCAYVSHVVMHGDGRPYCVALLTLSEPHTRRWAQDHGVPFSSLQDLAVRPEIRDLLQGYVDAVNRDLPPFEQVRRFAILAEDFTQENGLLTPSLKVKRKEVEQRYRSLLDGFYEPGHSRTPVFAHRR
jgi:long-chain acyl-CoA synthetase